MATHATKTDADRLADALEVVRKKNLELNDNKRTIAQLQREKDTAEAIRQEIFQLASHTPEPPSWVAGKGVKNGTRGGPVLILSDVHYGEVINPDEVGGVNEYNHKIAAKRLKTLTDTTIDLATNHMGRANVAYPGMVLCLGGDLIGGDIHEELSWSNDRTSQQSVNDLTDLLAGMIESFATKFGRVFCPTAIGNHGRGTFKGHYKGRAYTNFDWTIACNLERFFRKEKHIQFQIPAGADARFDLFGTRFLLTHGDTLGVKGGDGIIGVLGPLARGRLKVGQSEAAIGRDFDVLLCGHYHQLVFLPNLICNGCVKGYDEYAKLALRAPYSPPSQALFFVHPEHGITARWPVFLEPKRTLGKERTWVSWEQQNAV
jgi:hypothetical protein